jgi:hypothetical protein
MPSPRSWAPLPPAVDKRWIPPVGDGRWTDSILGTLWGAYVNLSYEGYFRLSEDVSETLQRLERTLLLPQADDICGSRIPLSSGGARPCMRAEGHEGKH